MTSSSLDALGESASVALEPASVELLLDSAMVELLDSAMVEPLDSDSATVELPTVDMCGNKPCVTTRRMFLLSPLSVPDLALAWAG